MKKQALFCMLLLAGGLTVASAAIINVDFNKAGGASGTYSGLGAYTGDTGTYWNGFTVTGEGATSGNLKTSNGVTPTLVNMTLNWESPDDTAPGHAAACASALMSDYLYLGRNNPPGTFTINGLLAGETYQLYLYSQNGAYGSLTSVFNVGAATATATGAGDVATFTQNVNYVIFANITADVNGTITGSGNPYYAAFNGLQIIGPIPEPASLALLGLGGLALLRRRRC